MYTLCLFSVRLLCTVLIKGGPGTGKGTQSEKLVKDWGFVHLSAGELLRAEQEREGSQYGALIKKFIAEGEIVPMEITVGLLQKAMEENIRKDRRKILIDGFPRKMDQALAFEANVCLFLMLLRIGLRKPNCLVFGGPRGSNGQTSYGKRS
jgi:UMP-CMP kinase